MNLNDIKTIACIGAGTVGSSWATYFLMKGFKVKVQDINEEIIENSKSRIIANFNTLMEKKVITEDKFEELDTLLTFTTKISEAVEDAQFIQESALEKYEVKEKIIKEVDAYADEKTIYASSSSGLLVSRLQEYSKYPGRVIVGHPFNPPHLIPLVEIVKGEADENIVALAYEFYREIGKVPIIIHKEVPGHVANRIQAALWRESIDLVMNGVCSVSDVDAAVAYGPGLRWSLLGPHMIFNLGGGERGIEAFFEQFTGSFETWWTDMAMWNEFPSKCKEVLAEGIKEEMGSRTLPEIKEWRDEKLVELLKILGVY